MESDWDFLKIYDGIDADADLLYTSGSMGNETISITSKNSSFNLFITIVSDSNFNGSGFFLEATTPSPLPGKPVTREQGQIVIEKLNYDKHTIRDTKNKRLGGVNQKLSPGLSKNVSFTLRKFQGSKNRAVNTKM